jgi:hypothetical protein
VVRDNRKEDMEKDKAPFEDAGVEVTIQPTTTDKELPELHANGYTAKTQNTIGIKSSVDDSREGFLRP